MKPLLFLSLLSISAGSFAVPPTYKVVAETTNDCGEKIKIFAQEGKSDVYAVRNAEETKLIAEGGEAYKKDGPHTVIFEGAGYTFVQPSMANGNPPKINIASNDKYEKCNLKLK